MKTLADAQAKLPADAEWSACFGYPGEGGYAEYYRRPNGETIFITNGSYELTHHEFDWQLNRIDAAGCTIERNYKA